MKLISGFFLTSSFLHSDYNFTVVDRSCLSEDVCPKPNGSKFIASVAVGETTMTFTSTCCTTDGCNNINLAGPNKTVNGVWCKTCSSMTDETCDADMMCVGDQDRCLNDTGSLLPFGFGNKTLKGCISRNLCYPSNFANVTCYRGFSNTGVSWFSEVNVILPFLSFTLHLQLWG
ncbi:hypothetical protein DNTS_035451 [Danionella cerebrum]|uniref:UPAR/Ly6 domain-containing protein n=1 Tax=Danionella cerebrum TaxID=2873325 RepID=A0A553QPP3_9TELE|nr:hypothetical protein DNTS_035451 [Danionella translucida]